MAKLDGGNKVGTWIYERDGVDRALWADMSGDLADAAVGGLEHGSELMVLTKGQWSLVDLLRSVSRKVGPCDLTICVWVAGAEDIIEIRRMLDVGALRSVSWLIDAFFPNRRQKEADALRDNFGPEHVRATRTHAKFCLLQNEEWNVAVRSSMNLNRNPRLEYVEISESAKVCAFFRSVVDEVFDAQIVGDVWVARQGDLTQSLRAVELDPYSAQPWGQQSELEVEGEDLGVL